MKIYYELQKYKDRNKFYQDKTNGTEGETSQNSALFNLECLFLILSSEDVSEDIKRIEVNRMKPLYKSLEVYPGVSVRKPGDREFDSMDNTGAIATFSGLFDNGEYSKRSFDHGNNTYAVGIDMGQAVEKNVKFYNIARIGTALLYCWNPVNLYRFIKAGRAPKFFWNNNNPNLYCMNGWHGRSPSHVPYLRMTAGLYVGPFGQLAILVGLFIGCFMDKKESDARKLPYLQWQFLKKRNFFWKAAYKLWCKILMKQYPNGMRDVYSNYFSDPTHPLRTDSKPFIE
jgi:hypothetical protein